MIPVIPARRNRAEISRIWLETTIRLIPGLIPATVLIPVLIPVRNSIVMRVLETLQTLELEMGALRKRQTSRYQRTSDRGKPPRLKSFELAVNRTAVSPRKSKSARYRSLWPMAWQRGSRGPKYSEKVRAHERDMRAADRVLPCVWRGAHLLLRPAASTPRPNRSGAGLS